MKLELTPEAIELITQAEGLDQPGRHPGGASGVTIGIGYDLGYYTREQFERDWGSQLSLLEFERLAEAIGKTGNAARAACAQYRDIKISREAAEKVFHNSTLPTFAERAGRAFPGAELLPEAAQGALVSIVFNRGEAMDGDRRREMRNIRSAISTWAAKHRDVPGSLADVLEFVAGQIRGMKRLWVGQGLDGLLKRRDAEAALVESVIPAATT